MSRLHHVCRVLLLTAMGGCAPSAPDPGAGADAHARPAHHPGTITGAVTALRARAVRLGGPTDEADRARRECVDIVRWLPLLAADTTLGRTDWEEVAALADRAAVRLAAHADGDSAALAVHIAEAADRLESIVTSRAVNTEEP
ncbi:MAG: hypothetical protein EBR86_02460 [Planctomycetia bacterium]|nr:hypothetical protein [Planctomycetia bacterium]